MTKEQIIEIARQKGLDVKSVAQCCNWCIEEDVDWGDLEHPMADTVMSIAAGQGGVLLLNGTRAPIQKVNII